MFPVMSLGSCVLPFRIRPLAYMSSEVLPFKGQSMNCLPQHGHRAPEKLRVSGWTSDVLNQNGQVIHTKVGVALL